jgi:hypothetical protein
MGERVCGASFSVQCLSSVRSSPVVRLLLLSNFFVQGNAIATYNILHNEGRTVLAALVQKAEPPVVERKLTRSQQMRAKLGYWQF